MRERARTARLSAARMTANAVDPFGLRYGALALLAVAFVAAGKDAGERLAFGFIPGDPRAAKAGFADLWIEPPGYAGKAPIYLLRANDTLAGLRAQIDVPEGSVVHAQVKAGARFGLSLKTPEETLRGEREGPAASARMRLNWPS